MRFAIFPLHLSKVLRLPRKSDARSYEVLHLSRKIILPNLQIWCSKMQPLSINQRPHLLTSLMTMSLVLRLPREIHLSKSSSNVPHLPSFLKLLQNPHVLLTFDTVHNPLRLPRETTSEHQKVVRTFGAFKILTWKRASHHNGVHFFDISTSKSAPKLVCFVHFDLEMCFGPQRRALFSTSQLPKVLRAWCVLDILGKVLRATTARTFFDITTSKSAPNATFLPFRAWIFFLLNFSSLIFFLLLFCDSSHLCFSSVHIVGSLTSKLPSICRLITVYTICHYIIRSRPPNIVRRTCFSHPEMGIWLH